MTLGDKIIKERKIRGWSQEELAERLGVSRQAVSKWESSGTVPDLDRIIQMSILFDVSTDYLLKNEVEEKDEYPQEVQEKQGRKISIEEAHSYLIEVAYVSKKIAAGVLLCILSPVMLILMAALSEQRGTAISENMAAGAGCVILFCFVACAVAIFIVYGMRLKKYEYIEKEKIYTEKEVSELTAKRKAEYEPFYRRKITVGVVICIASVIPLFLAAAFNAPELTYIICVDVILIAVAAGVFIIVEASMIMGSFNALLEEEDYTRDKKERKNSPVAGIYWCTVTAIYLACSFLTERWDMTWIIFACAGLLFPLTYGISKRLKR